MENLKLNLQMFANEDDDYLDDYEENDLLDEEIEEHDFDEEETEEEIDEDLDEEIEEELDDEINVDSKVKSVPLKALKKEREKAKAREEELKRQLAELSKKAEIVNKLKRNDQLKDISDEDLINNLELAEAQKYINSGISEQEARQIVRNNEKVDLLEKRLREFEINKEFEEMVKNPIFATAKDSKDKIVSVSIEKGLTLTQAFFFLEGENVAKSRLKELDRAKKYKKNVSVDTNGQSAPRKIDPKLTPELQKALKEFGMTYEEYKKL